MGLELCQCDLRGNLLELELHPLRHEKIAGELGRFPTNSVIPKKQEEKELHLYRSGQ